MKGNNALLSCIRNINKAGRIALCGYFLAGYSSPEDFFKKVRVASELDIFEFGIPTVDPFLDGPVISNAHKKVIDHLGIYTESALALIGALWEVPQPRFVMTYANERRNYKDFLKRCTKNNIQGIFSPDIDLQEAQYVSEVSEEFNLAFLNFINGNLVEEDMVQKIEISDIVYLKVSKGTTGDLADIKGPLYQHLSETILRIRNHKPEILITVGVGIQNPEQIKSLAGLDINMVIVGTKLMEYMKLGEEQLANYIHKLREATFFPNNDNKRFPKYYCNNNKFSYNFEKRAEEREKSF